MPKRLLLHIGFAKTGTTSIQNALHSAQKKELFRNLSYPVIHGRPNQHGLVALYKSYDRLPVRYKALWTKSVAEYETLKLHVRTSLDEAMAISANIILSSEYLAQCNLDELALLKADISKFSITDLKVVIYTRHPSDFYLSFVQQSLKANHKTPDPRSVRFRFKKQIECWENCFPGCVEVRSYDRSLMRDGNVVSDFLGCASRFFDTDISPDLAANQESNVSLSAEAMILLQGFRCKYYSTQENVFTKDCVSLVRLLGSSRQYVQQTKPELRTAIYNMVYDQHIEDIDYLDEFWGISYKAGEPVGKEALEFNPETIDICDVKTILKTYDQTAVEELSYYALHKSLA